jgi:hypothetical protein
MFLRDDLLANAGKSFEIGGKVFGLMADAGNDGAEKNGAADGGQRVFRRHKQRRGRIASHPLQRRQHLGEHAAPGAQRCVNGVFLCPQCR